MVPYTFEDYFWGRSRDTSRRRFELYLRCSVSIYGNIKKIISQNYLVTNLLIVFHRFVFFKVPHF